MVSCHVFYSCVYVQNSLVDSISPPCILNLYALKSPLLKVYVHFLNPSVTSLFEGFNDFENNKENNLSYFEIILVVTVFEFKHIDR